MSRDPLADLTAALAEALDEHAGPGWLPGTYSTDFVGPTQAVAVGWAAAAITAALPQPILDQLALGAAWDRAVAALPEGWVRLELLNPNYRDGEEGWMALASERDEPRRFKAEYGPTPAAALLALAERLEKEKG